MKNVVADFYHFSSAIATYSFLQGRFLLSFVIFLIFSNFLKFLSYVVPQLVRYLEHAVCNKHFSRFANFDDLFKLVLLIGYLYVMPFIDFTFNLYCIILTLDNSVLYKF